MNVSQFYDDYWKDRSRRREHVTRQWWHPAYERVHAQLEGGRKVLVLGCGSGDEVAPLRERGFDVVGADLSMAAAVQTHATGCTAVRAQAESLPFASGSFDRVWISNMLMFTHREQVLAEARRVTTSGGRIILLEPMAHPHLIVLLRKLQNFPGVKAYWEHADLQRFQGEFADGEQEVYFLLSPLWAGLLYSRDLGKLGDGVLSALRGVDKRLLKAVPSLKRWGYLAVVTYVVRP